MKKIHTLINRKSAENIHPLINIKGEENTHINRKDGETREG